MVSLNLSVDFYKLRKEIRRELISRLSSITINNYSIDSAWLSYALSFEKKSNPFFEKSIRILEKWICSGGSGSKDKDLAPLSLCSCFSSNEEIKIKAIEKFKKILERVLPKSHLKFNVLNDPEQVFCASLLLKNIEDFKGNVIEVVKNNFNGCLTRKVLFIASLIELEEDVSDFVDTLKTETLDTPEDIISILWLVERYRGKLDKEPLDIWKTFDEFHPGITIVNKGNNSVLSNKILALLYEAVLKEITGPEPNMLFDLYPLNPELKKIANDYFKRKKYAVCIFEVTKKLNEFIQKKSGITNKNEAELVQATMKLIKKNPVIQFNEYLNEDSGKSEQSGIALIAEGIFRAFRNPKGHKPEDHPLLEMGAYEALNQLIIIDYVWKRIESAKIKIKK